MAGPVHKFEMLANRVRKNARHLGKWAKREQVSCWRVYDEDIPELPITVDTYEGALVVNDYRHTDENGERGGGNEWLLAAADAAKEAFGATEVFIKQRERFTHREGDQYERGAQDVWRTVHEGGHAFRVNLRGYIDTGLFLDHRITRSRAAHENGETFLNLYAYTGAFSVHAAAQNKRVTTVDLSNTYLDWARENLELNKLPTGDIIHADVREFLAEAKRAGRTWDTIVVDPPTFSNSKRMDYVWDVQRDHAALLADVEAVWSGTGAIWFSTNKRKFKIGWQPARGRLEEQTEFTVPPDFRGKPHHSYRVS